MPVGSFPDGHDGEDHDRGDERALQLWIEGKAERIEKVAGPRGSTYCV